MSAFLNFDAEGVDPAKPFEVLPPDRYHVYISGTEMKPTKANTGEYLEVEYTVVDGDYEGRKLWSRHNIVNPSEKAQQIARQELSAICHAVGVLKVEDSAELHDRPLLIEVGIEKNRQNDTDVNRVKAWMPASGAAPAKTAAKPAPKAPTPAAAGAKAPPPWAKKAAA